MEMIVIAVSMKMPRAFYKPESIQPKLAIYTRPSNNGGSRN